LDTANKRITDLPTIPEYVKNWRPFVCWVHLLGRCKFPNCTFKNGHAPCSGILDAFLEEVVTMLTAEINHCAHAREQEGSPANGIGPTQKPDRQRGPKQEDQNGEWGNQQRSNKHGKY
jgi:hypothetical protein